MFLISFRFYFYSILVLAFIHTYSCRAQELSTINSAAHLSLFMDSMYDTLTSSGVKVGTNWPDADADEDVIDESEVLVGPPPEAVSWPHEYVFALFPFNTLN